MNLQFIHDNRGNTTGVFIPIEEWQTLKTKYADLQKEEVENVVELASWQKQIIDENIEEDDLDRQNKIKILDEKIINDRINDIEKGL